jgi:predicted DNA-binding helix-hairpin-helix protein
MFYNYCVDDQVSRLQMLSAQMSFEPDAEIRASGEQITDSTLPCDQDAIYVHPAVLPNGQRIKLLKTLLSSACERDCYYCPFRAGRDMRRATFQPEEFARLFLSLAQKGIAEGVFLSSGMVGGGVRTEDKLIDTADILRHKLDFRGYIHLKVMPGVERAQVERAMQLANRVSVNLEAPNTARLTRLAPHKEFMEELLQPLKWIEEIRRTQPATKGWNGHWPSSVTQFVAGGAGESDLELLTTTQYLYHRLGLKRAYYSRFKPIPDTPLEDQAPVAPIREHRLYQASFLLRDYGFDLEELPFELDGQLPVRADPKAVWADVHLRETPVEVNRAERTDLLHVPGIGPKGVEAILKARRQSRIRELTALRKLGVMVERAAPFLLLDGRHAVYQPNLF